MTSLNVVRVKRKADEEPAEALVIALKRLKSDEETNEVYLKLATTLTNRADFNNDIVRDVISRDKLQNIRQGKSPKRISSSSSFSKRLQILKAQRNERRDQVLADRRLILTQDISGYQSENSNGSSDFSKVRDVFKLYDIIEENEESKSSEDDRKTSGYSEITCNGAPMIRLNGSKEEMSEYVYDVYYVADGHLDDRFVDESVSIQPCEINEELVYDSDEPEEYYDDEDDSNDECNWRNDYPDEDSDFEKNYDYYEYGDDEGQEHGDYEICNQFKKFAIDEDKLGAKYARYKARVLNEIESEEM